MEAQRWPLRIGGTPISNLFTVTPGATDARRTLSGGAGVEPHGVSSMRAEHFMELCSIFFLTASASVVLYALLFALFRIEDFLAERVPRANNESGNAHRRSLHGIRLFVPLDAATISECDSSITSHLSPRGAETAKVLMRSALTPSHPKRERDQTRKPFTEFTADRGETVDVRPRASWPHRAFESTYNDGLRGADVLARIARDVVKENRLVQRKIAELRCIGEREGAIECAGLHHQLILMRQFCSSVAETAEHYADLETNRSLERYRRERMAVRLQAELRVLRLLATALDTIAN